MNNYSDDNTKKTNIDDSSTKEPEEQQRYKNEKPMGSKGGRAEYTKDEGTDRDSSRQAGILPEEE